MQMKSENVRFPKVEPGLAKQIYNIYIYNEWVEAIATLRLYISAEDNYIFLRQKQNNRNSYK